MGESPTSILFVETRLTHPQQKKGYGHAVVEGHICSKPFNGELFKGEVF